MAAREDELRSEPGQQLGDACADAAETDEADRRAAQLAPEKLLGLPARPLAAAQDLVGLDDPPPGGEHERHGELGGRVGQDVGRVRRAHAALAHRLGVDVVVADGEVRDDLQRRAGPAQQRAVDGHGRVGHEGVGAGHVFLQPHPVERDAATRDVTARREPIQPGGGQRAGHDNSHDGKGSRLRWCAAGIATRGISSQRTSAGR